MKKLFYNGNFITVDKKLPRAEAVLVEDGTIQAVGTLAQLAEAAGDAQRVDMQQRTVTPAFCDSHMHVLSLGMFLKDVSLHTADSIEEVVRRGRAYIEEHHIQAGTWIRGRGWNHDKFQDEARFLTRDDLDRISLDCPIAFTRTCGHVISVNTAALKLIGMTESARQIEGGQIDVDGNGRPLGIFREQARQLVLDAIPEKSAEEIRELILLTTQEALAHGVTTIQSDDFKDVPTNFQKVIDVYEQLRREGNLKIRVYEQCNLPVLEKLRDFLGRGYNTGYGDELFRIGPFKVISDGALGARTAYLREPYTDVPTTRGIPFFSQEELDALILEAHRAGMQIAIHAIGDAGMDMVMNAIEKARRQYPRTGERHGIIHCQITHHDQLDRMKAMDLIAYIQPIFLNYDISIIDDRIGAQRASTSYNWKEFLDKEIPISGGSDCPVESLDIMDNIYAAVTRKTLAGQPDGGWRPDQCITVEQALESFTMGGAYASFSEDRKGSITPGKVADFAVLSADLLAVAPDAIKDIDVLQTYLNGELVFDRAAQ